MIIELIFYNIYFNFFLNLNVEDSTSPVKAYPLT